MRRAVTQRVDKLSDKKVLKSYRLKRAVLTRIEEIRLDEGKRTGKIPSAAEVLEKLVLGRNV
jgi:hypothetical protein